MYDRLKFLAAHLQSDFYLQLRFRLIAEIERHEKDQDGIWKEYESAIAEMSQGIVQGTLTRYNLNDEYVTNHYGVTDFVDAELLCELAFYKAGRIMSEREGNPTLERLEEFEENMDGGFFLEYEPEKEHLASLVASLAGKAMEVAAKSKNYERQEGALERFYQELEKEHDEDELIKKINHYNDGGYMMLWGAVVFLGYHYIRKGWWEDFSQLLENLKYFPMQGGLIRLLETTEDIESVSNQVLNGSARKSVLYLLREQWFRTICSEGSILKDNIEANGIDEEVKAYVGTVSGEFEARKQELIKNDTAMWVKIFGKEEMTTWVSRKMSEAEGKHLKYGEPESEVLKIADVELSLTTDDVKGFDLKEKDFASLLAIAEKMKDKYIAEELIKAIAKNVFSESSYPDTVLKDAWFQKLRIVYRCLQQSQLDGLNFIYENRKPLEGYKVDLVAAMRTARQEAYWMAMLILSLEENNDPGLFRKYIDVLISETSRSIDSMTDDVFTPFYVAEMLVTQAMKSEKDWYEKRLINDIPYLVFVIRVLTANQGEMSSDVKSVFRNRVNQEWVVERELLRQYKRVNLKFYDDFLEMCR